MVAFDDRRLDALMQRAAELDYFEMLKEIDAECGGADRAGRTKRGRENGAADYANRLKKILFWLRHMSIKPDGIREDDWARCRMLTKCLVAKSQIRPEAMAVFR